MFYIPTPFWDGGNSGWVQIGGVWVWSGPAANPGGDHDAGGVDANGYPLVRFQCTFGGASSEDISWYAIGPGTLINGVLADIDGTYGTLTTTMGPPTYGDDRDIRRIRWVDKSMELGLYSVSPWPTDVMTFEAFFSVSVYGGIGGSSPLLSTGGGDQSMSLNLNGNTNYMDVTVTGSGSVFTDTVAVGTNTHHIANVYRNTGGTKTYDQYIDGVRVWKDQAWSDLYLTPGEVQLGGTTQGTPDQRIYTFYGARCIALEMYFGDSFTPLSGPADWGLP